MIKYFFRTFHLVLFNNNEVPSSFSKDAKIFFGGVDISEESLNILKKTSYFGHLKGLDYCLILIKILDENSSKVNGNIVNGIFTGDIKTKDENYYIKNIKAYDDLKNLDPKYHSIIYSSVDIVYPNSKAIWFIYFFYNLKI